MFLSLIQTNCDLPGIVMITRVGNLHKLKSVNTSEPVHSQDLE